MTSITVRDAEKSELKAIAGQLLELRRRLPGFAAQLNSPVRRFLLANFAAPRYLRSGAYALVLEQDARPVGFGVVEQAGNALYLADYHTASGSDRRALLVALAERVERMAREREYPFARISVWEPDEEAVAAFQQAGYQWLDFYLWSYAGQVQGGRAVDELSFRELTGKEAAATRVQFVQAELDDSQVGGRQLIDEVFLTRHPPHPALAIAYQPGGQPEPRTIGYLSPRPNERGDGVLSLVLALEPQQWGSDLEIDAIRGYLEQMGEGSDQPVRVLVSTTAHAQRSEPAFTALGLRRELDTGPIMYKDLEIGGL